MTESSRTSTTMPQESSNLKKCSSRSGGGCGDAIRIGAESNHKCLYSRANISFLIALTVSFGFLIASPSSRSTFLVAATSHQDTTISLKNSSRAISTYLIYSGESADGVRKSDKLIRLLKDENHTHSSDAIDLQMANEVWRDWSKQLGNYARDRAELMRPSLEDLMSKAGVGSACKQSLLETIDHLAKLDSWAVRMYNSFGNFPAAGFFEGTHTSMGSYHQCVNVEPNEWIGAPQYCTFKFQPIIPKRPRYHNILATIDNLANFTERNHIFHGLAKKAHYFYYTKLRLATCMPTKCEKNDLKQLGEQIALNTYLQYQGVQCLEKSPGFKPDRVQMFALIVLGLMASVSLLGTLVHLLNLRSLLQNRASSSTKLHHLNHSNKHHHLHLNLKSACNGKTSAFDQSMTLQQQKLLGQQQQCLRIPLAPGSILPAPAAAAASSPSLTPTTAALSRRALALVDVLMHFSIISNSRKLFDSSTSRRAHAAAKSRRHPAGSLVPGMREAVAVGVVISDGSSSGGASSSSAASQSDASSAAGEDEDDQSGSGADGTRSNDISCVHGLRFWTISWIILGHTMQYTEWAGFGRAYQVEQNITSFFLHPLLNATFSVDTFFLISGLLTTYVTWSITRGQLWRFNKFAFLISRYLRLMPQVLIVILIFIVFPLMGDGPYWRGMIQKESDNCKRNWWVSALFLQSFYRSDEICNLVTWWLSIEMFYHFVSIIVILALLRSARKGLFAAVAIGGGLTAWSCHLHYANSYPPNMLPTLLQRYEIWNSIVLKYFWTPYPHAPSYFVGLLLGYALYNRSIASLSKRQVRYGWFAFAICYMTILFGTYHWNNNAPYSRFASTAYYNLAQVFWSVATGWAILACALGHGGWLNDFLSSPVFVPLGRATYMTYLSHMLIIMSYPAKQNLLIEPSYIVFLYIFISNLCLSYLLGIVLTLVYESPILHLQKLLVTGMASKFNSADDPKLKQRERQKRIGSTIGPRNDDDDDATVRVSLYDPPTSELADKKTPDEGVFKQVPAPS